MAVDKYGSAILKSLFGRRLGLDVNDFLVGHSGPRDPSETSTAGSTLPNYGLSILTGSTASHTLNGASAVGVRKVIVNASSVSTATMSVTRGTSAISFLGSTGGDASGAKINLLNAGSNIEMISISTSVWAICGVKPSTLLQSMSTSS